MVKRTISSLSSNRQPFHPYSCISCRLSGPAVSRHLILLRNVLERTVFIGRMMERAPASQDKQLLCSLRCSPGPRFAAGIAQAASTVMSSHSAAGKGRPPSFRNTGQRLRHMW